MSELGFRGFRLKERYHDLREQLIDLSSGDGSREEVQDVLRQYVDVLKKLDELEDDDRWREKLEAIKKARKSQKDELEVVDDDGGAETTSKSEEEEGSQHFEFSTPDHDFDEVGGMWDVKEVLTSKVLNPLREPERYRHLDLHVPNGVLCFGPPRTGKTHVLKAVPGELGIDYLHIRGRDIKNKFQGESEKNIGRLFDQALDNQPCLILMNEVDSLTEERDIAGNSDGKKVDIVNEFLQGIEDLEGEDVSVLGTTNRINAIDGAFTSPGRFEEQIAVGLPDLQTRFKVLQVHLRKPAVDEDSLSLRQLARATEGYTCGDLRKLVKDAAFIAAENRDPEIRQDHLVEAFHSTEPSVDNPGEYLR